MNRYINTSGIWPMIIGEENWKLYSKIIQFTVDQVEQVLEKTILTEIPASSLSGVIQEDDESIYIFRELLCDAIRDRKLELSIDVVSILSGRTKNEIREIMNSNPEF